MKGKVVKIGDFGLAKAMESSGAATRGGTVEYMSPEVYQYETYNLEPDIWSLGMVFLELLTGQRITKLLEGKKPPCLRKDFPSEEILEKIKLKGMRNLIKLMLQRDIDLRPSAKKVLEFLNQYNLLD